MMRKILQSGVCLTCLCAFGLATTSCSNDGSNEASAAESGASVHKTELTVPSGTSMTFTVQNEVSTENRRAGDQFTSTLARDVTTADGEVALPAGAPGRWLVTAATDDNGQGQAVLAVRLESVKVHGSWDPVDATVVSSDVQRQAKDSDTKTAAKIGIGTAAGALVGQILGHSGEATAKGAGVGALMGTAIALSTRGGSAKIAAGSHITVKLNNSLTLE